MALMMRASTVARPTVATKASRAPVVVKASLKQAVQSAAIGAAALALSASAAFAAEVVVQLGAEDGSTVFVPSSVTINAGDTVKWVNYKSFPHNVVFDEDTVPGGDGDLAASLSHEEYLNGPGDEVKSTFSTAGTYGYLCEPHKGAGMKGTVIVK